MTGSGQSRLTPRFSLRVKGMLVLAIPIVALLASVIAVLSLERGMRAADEMVRHALAVRTQLQEVQWLLMDAETGLRGYLLTGDERFREPYEHAAASLESSVARLSVLASANGTPSARIRDIEQSAREELDILRLLRQTPSGSRPDRDLILRSQAVLEHLRSLLGSLWADLDRLFDVAGNTRLVRYQQFSFVALLCVVIGPFGGLLLNVFLSDRLVRRVREVGLNAHRLATGQPLRKLPPGNDEISILGRELEEAAFLLRAREQRLSESEKRFRELFDRAPVPYHEAGPDGIIQRVNVAECRLLGYPPEQIVGRPAWDFVVPDEQDATRERLLEAIRTGQEIPPLERDYVLADGSSITVEIHENLIRSEYGEVAGVRAALLDVTEHKVAVMAARKVEQYAAELRSKNEQLARAAAAANAATVAKSRFLASMSHELRTPLNSIIGFSELMHDGKVGTVSEEHRDFLADILTSGRHLLQLINDVLDLSKIEAGKFEFRPERSDLGRLAREVCDVVRPLADKKSLRLQVDALPGMQAIIDPARFKQVLYNYVSNAVKFTPSLGRITIRLAPAGSLRFRVEVEDNGIGIAAADLPRLFSEFEQFGASRRLGQGSGLGLALTKRLVEAQGGSVGVDSTPGQGSLFFAELPLTPDGKPLDGTPRSLRPRSVLVVEDSSQESRWLCQILREAGYAVETARTSSEAIAQSSARAFDAITLDLLLPDASGWEVLQQIRSTGLNRSTPVIVVSVAVEKDMGKLFPIQDCLPKPVQPADLLQALDRAGVPPHRNRTVLVVDDDPATQRLVQATLAGLGYKAVCRADGESALASLVQERPAVVLLDLMMPVLDGFQFLERLRDDPLLPHPPVIVWTNKDLTAADQARLQGMAEAVMAKQDCTPKALLEQLRVIVG